jgi:hypothetical protein
MDNDKNIDFDPVSPPKENEFTNESSSRARNRTVMLTPEITGQVRARLAQEIDPVAAPPPARDNGFEPVVGRGAGFSPPPAAAEPRSRNEGRVEPSYASPAPAARPPVASPSPASRERGIVWLKESPVVGFMVSYDENPNGDIFVLRSGRLMVTSDPTQGENSLVVEDPSVSPMHAILRITPAGEIQILDQLSEFGTHIRRFGSMEEEQLSGDKSSLDHGDIVKFGNRTFHICIVALEGRG